VTYQYAAITPRKGGGFYIKLAGLNVGYASSPEIAERTCEVTAKPSVLNFGRRLHVEVREGSLFGATVYRVFFAGVYTLLEFTASAAEVHADRIEAGARALVKRIKTTKAKAR
jgi:hypothetical protein